MTNMENPKRTMTILLDDKALEQMETAYERHSARYSTVSDGSRDRRDMARMGRKSELKRNFDIYTSIGYSSVVSSSWEITMVGFMYSMVNGGLAGTFWMFIVASCGMLAVTFSMAEMASMAPTEGAQYHWVSELAPRRIQKFLSFLVGYLSVMGWHALFSFVVYLTARQFQVMISLSQPDYHPKMWHVACMAIPMILLAMLSNLFVLKKLPWIEGLLFLLHIFGFCFVIVVIWVMGPHEDAPTVFTQFSSITGWGDISMGIACLVALTPPTTVLTGADSACHVAEEVRNASWAVPRAMMATTVINSLMALMIVLTLVFNIGSVDSVLYPEHVLSYVSVFHTASQSVAATYVCVSLLAVLLCFCAINRATSASRQLYAFARDEGLPFSKWLSHVNPGSAVPRNSIMASSLLSTMIIPVVAGSRSAWQYISTTATSCVLLSYWIAVAVLIWRKLSGGRLPPSQYHTGRARSMIINMFAIAFLTIAVIFSFFPLNPDAGASDVNWNVVVVPTAILFCGLYYAFHGKRHYKAPVEKVKK